MAEVTDSQSSELDRLLELAGVCCRDQSQEALRLALSEVLRQREEYRLQAEYANTVTQWCHDHHSDVALQIAESRVERAEQERDEARHEAEMARDAAWEMNYEHGTKYVLPWERLLRLRSRGEPMNDANQELRELDRRVAIEVMGDVQGQALGPRAYSSTWEGMRLVVEKMREKGFSRVEIHSVEDVYLCQIEVGSGGVEERYVAQVEAPTAPEAVCRAALAALAPTPGDAVESL